MTMIKKSAAFVLIAAIMLSIMIIPAAALENGWPDRISKFREVAEYNDSIYPGYVKAAQRFFICYSVTKDAMGSSTVDGDFGPATFAALRAFRKTKGLSANDLMDSDAWRALAKELDGETKYSNPTRYILSEDGGNVMLVGVGPYSYSYYYYTSQYGLNSSDAFHVG